jgi:hypothetical protein
MSRPTRRNNLGISDGFYFIFVLFFLHFFVLFLLFILSLISVLCIFHVSIDVFSADFSALIAIYPPFIAPVLLIQHPVFHCLLLIKCLWLITVRFSFLLSYYIVFHFCSASVLSFSSTIIVLSTIAMFSATTTPHVLFFNVPDDDDVPRCHGCNVDLTHTHGFYTIDFMLAA